MSDDLWNDRAEERLYSGDKIAYQQAVIEQYKLYVEMADRISQRRGFTNTFFLTFNTAIFSLIASFWERSPGGGEWWLIIPLLVILGQCSAWFYLVRSYRLLNSAKYKVIGDIEQRLPASPYWRAEWSALGEGKDPSRYWPLTHIEKWVPVLFGCMYVAGFLAALVT